LVAASNKISPAQTQQMLRTSILNALYFKKNSTTISTTDDLKRIEE
jgi:2-C-methyl-D-erythritol 4-phosphate cytidylyltransferase